MKKTLKIACVAMILIIVAVMVIVNISSATSINISTDKTECNVDGEIEVTFSISGLCTEGEITEDETNIQILIDYDDSYLTYIGYSSNGGYTIDGSSSSTSIEVSGTAQDSISFTLIFLAKESGTASLSISGINYRR